MNKRKSKRILLQRGENNSHMKLDDNIRIEKVFNMVAPNPRYNPSMPSFLYIRNSTAIIERLSLLPPLAPEGSAWIRVLALLAGSVSLSFWRTLVKRIHI